jgi:AcrR family transcriptional regulator
MILMTVRDQPEPGVGGVAGDRAERSACGHEVRQPRADAASEHEERRLRADAASEHEERRLRADAARNRDAIVAVARDVFAEHGLEAPLEAIAARAGVGIATLYRRFPTREKLVAAALVEKVAEYVGAARQALAAPDPWDGFAGVVERICELQAGDRGLSDLLSMTLSADERVEELRRTANDLLIAVIDRAKAAGTLREDFVGEDLVLLLIATAAVMHVTRADAPDAWRRFVALALDSFSIGGSPPRPDSALPDPPSTAQMTRAMIRLARARGCGERA